jgi:ankyrin repeat protein
MLVIPGLMGICVWSPRLDAHGNSADRWGGTPLSDADGNGHTEIAALLREHAEEAAPLSRSDQ